MLGFWIHRGAEGIRRLEAVVGVACRALGCGARLGLLRTVVVLFAFASGPAVAQAASFSWSGPVALDATGGPGHLMYGVACPSTSQCTAVDFGVGQQVTFDPGGPVSPAPTTIDSGNTLSSVACPAANQCTAVDYVGQEVTFDPAAPG